MDVADFLTQFVEGYLLEDLANMERIVPKPGATAGAVGYPIVQACLGGIELLGGLLADEEFSTKNDAGGRYFCAYWDNYLRRVDGSYVALENLSGVVYKLVRNGVAHQFLTKPGVDIRKGENRKDHLTWDSSSRILRIDSMWLASDLRASYWRFVRPLSDRSVFRSEMQHQLDTMIEKYNGQSLKAFDDAHWPMPNVVTTTVEAGPLTSGMGIIDLTPVENKAGTVTATILPSQEVASFFPPPAPLK